MKNLRERHSKLAKDATFPSSTKAEYCEMRGVLTKWPFVKWMAVTLCGLSVWPCALLCQAQPTLGLPEPGLLLFGSVTNVAGGIPLLAPAVTWQISGGTNLVTVPATVVVVNGQFFHSACVPFETRSIGSAIFGQTPNVFALTASPSNYARSAWMGTNVCTFLNPSQTNFTFSKVDRGKTERVDLSVSIPTPNLDTDGDGMPDWAEAIAGTNPNDPNSVLKLSTNIRPGLPGGLLLEWSSISNKTYSVLSTTNLSMPFRPLATNLLATNNLTLYHDSGAFGSGPFFYRIQVNPNSSP